MPVHRVARAGFSQEPDRYDRSRPEYPAGVLELLGTLFGLRSSTQLVELGAGTGKFTQGLVDAGLRPIAIEPLRAMREELRRRALPIQIVGAVAERLPLRDDSIDAVVAAQSFHWFDIARALPELARVLKLWGGVGLVWNVRDERVPWQRELTRLLDEFREGTPTHHTKSWTQAFARSRAFETLSVRSFHHDQPMDDARLVDRVSSVSFIALLPPERRGKLLERVREVAREAPRDPGTGLFKMRYRTDLYWSRRIADA